MDTKLVLVGNDTDGELVIGEALPYAGGLWLATGWLVNHAERWRTPKRLIRLPADRLAPAGPGSPYELLLDCAIPKALLTDPGPLPAGHGFEVQEAPGIRIPLPTVQ